MFCAKTAQRRLAGGGDRRLKRGERHADRDVDAAVAAALRQELGDVLVRLRRRLEHLPVAGDVRLALRHRPEPPLRAVPCPPSSSSDAPPPVDSQSTLSASPNWAIAAPESPPPMTVYPGDAGDGLGDAARAGGERVELERAHRAVPEDRAGAARSRPRTARRSSGRRPGPSSRPGPRCRRARAPRCRRRTRARRPGRPAAAAGSRTPRPSRAPGGRARRPPPRPASRRSRLPCARKNEKHIAPPISSASAMSRKRSISATLSVTFAPPRTTTSGRSGASITPLQRRDLLLEQRAGVRRAGSCATPAVDACARCAEPERVQHERVGQLRELLGERRVVLRLARLPARVLEHQDLPRLEPRGAAPRLGPDHLGRLVDARADQLAEPLGHRRERRRRVGALRAAQVRAQDQLRARARAAARSPAAPRGCARRRRPARPSAAR